MACAIILLGGLSLAVREASARAPWEAQRTAVITAGKLPVWSDFYPTGWVTALPLSAGVLVSSPDGFAVGSTLFRTTVNGGATWSAWSNTGLNASLLDPTTLQIAVNGVTLPDSQLQNRIQFQITTGEDKVETSSAYVVRVDTVAPGPPTAMVSTPNTWTNVNSFGESWTNPSDTSGIAGAYYRLNSEPLFPSDGTFVTTTNVIDGIQAPSEGSHHMLVWLVDGAGNVDHLNYRVQLNAFRYDATPPTVDLASQGPLGQNGWYTGTVMLNFAPSDATSGVLTWGWRLDGGAPSTALSTEISAAGPHSLVLTASDRANNSMVPITRSIDVDPEPPVLSYNVTPTLTTAGWYTAPITVSFVLTDQISGPAGITWQQNNDPPAAGNVVSIAQDGLHALTAYGQDVAGNRSPAVNLSLPLDSHPPVTTLVLTPPEPQPSGFYTQPVAVQFEASDILTTTPPIAGSGVAGMLKRIDDGPWQMALPQTFTTSNVYQVSYYSFDTAGNVEISRTQVISIDMEAPAAPLAPVIEPAGWSASNSFSLSWQSPPDTSDIAGAYVWIGLGDVDPNAAVFYPQTTRIDGLAAPGEGEWPVWMALRDQAGNRGAFVDAGRVRYDATPPSVLAEPSGPLGNASWFIGPVQVVASITDAGSGPELLRYRLNGAPWQQVTNTVTLQITAPGRHVLDYYGQDRAGFLGGPAMAVVRIDPDPPATPIAAAITPTTWSNANQWTLSWRNPLDASGAALAHWSWQPPAGPQAGQTLPAAAQTLTLEPPNEGVHDLYLWLEDVAGNVSLDQMATLRGAIRYDATPPALRVQIEPIPNSAGWFRSPVLVTIDTDDSLSGVASTTWRLDDQPPATSASFVISEDGIRNLLVRSVDWAGNRSEEVHQLLIDTQPPQAQLMPLPTYYRDPQIPVEWAGSDDELGSGLDGFDVQVRQGAEGAWQMWLPGVRDTSGVYQGQRGQLYSFRARAIDIAGNVSPWAMAGGRNTVLVDAIDNGAFSTQNFTGWDTTVELGLTLIQEQDLFPGQVVPAARLGSPIWQACADPGNIPTLECGDSWSGISQQLVVPSLVDVPQPTLEFWYRMQTYDQITTTSPVWNIRCPIDPPPPFRWVDSFDVSIQVAGSAEPEVVLRTGNSEAQFPEPIEFRDTKWQRAEIDLTPYAGQTITLELSAHNRLDSRFNTWTDVYGMRVRGELRKTFLPLISVNAPPAVEEPIVCWPSRGSPPLSGSVPSEIVPDFYTPLNLTHAEESSR
ncbi:MAG TPA: hypothetical protein VL334_06745 [Anaerolineae bacterium]|nr:hypothetical protein [Anaerolineae bacterium]